MRQQLLLLQSQRRRRWLHSYITFAQSCMHSSIVLKAI